MDAAMLMIAARLDGRWVRPWRLLLGALTGAGCAWLARALALSQGQTAALWLPAAYLMQLAAQGRRGVLHPVRCVCLLLCAAGLLGGTLTALAGATESLVKAYALGGAMMTGMTVCLFRARHTTLDVRRAEVICRKDGRTARFEAMIDSGNTLRDYLTHRPVIVLAEKTGRRLLGLEDAVLRPIFADTAGGRQMMAVFVPQETVILLDGKRRRVLSAVALSGALSEDAPALVPASLLKEPSEESLEKSFEGSLKRSNEA